MRSSRLLLNTHGWYRDYYLLLTELLTTYPELRLGLLGPGLIEGLGLGLGLGLELGLGLGLGDSWAASAQG